MENGPFIDGLPIKNGDFHGYVSHNQMVEYVWCDSAPATVYSEVFPWDYFDWFPSSN